MHMADAMVVPAVAGVMSACSMGIAGYSVRQIRQEEEERNIPVMGVMGAFVFAAQMINFSIPGTGSSGHLCGGMMLTALLGPCLGFLTMMGVLLIQCLVFADGGLLALGCNVWNMAFYGCFIGAWIWKLIMRKGITQRKITAASIAGCVLTLQLGAFSVVLETTASGITSLPFSLFLAWMQPIHLAIGVVEGLITSAVLFFIYQARPELFWGVGSGKEKRRSVHSSWVIPVLFVLTLLAGGGLSLFASARPDGLEWSVQKITGNTELPGNKTVLENIQAQLALLPDYDWKGENLPAGTTVSGILGIILVLLLCIGAAKLFRALHCKPKQKSEGRAYGQD